ncbi:kinetoplast ribosomal PPR-repeat containing protein 3 [Novymonas esmeraldas]|uniref:Kinetoplast ribosomal PPR-repeat containing protein 3 n=1 Tax=Novymonas esmeraldas TaxID=1808958 RepID=A0AAW0FF79_9TRYP
MQRWSCARCGCRTPSRLLAAARGPWEAAATPLSALAHQRAFVLIPPVERLTSPASPRLSSSFADTQVRLDGTTQSAPSERLDSFCFAVKNTERGLLDHGVAPDALDFIAEAEQEYQASSVYLHAVPGGAAAPVSHTHVDETTGQTVTTTRVAAPFGETYVPSSRERFASRQHVGELSRQRELVDKPFMMNELAQLNLRKERQLCELLASPMPQLAKADEVAHMLLESFYEQTLALQPRTCESVMLLFSHASFLRRLEGPRTTTTTPAVDGVLPAGGAGGAAVPLTPHDVPFLDDMRRLYTHQKRCFVSPTSLTLEHLMTALSVVAAPSTAVFHLANRLLLDADKHVVLPTRTTYAAYFGVCHMNNAMQFAIARYTDAVHALQLPVDAPMLTALLKGLNESGYVEEAVALLTGVQHVVVSTPLLNAALETLLLSEQALSCFSLYAAMAGSAVRPNAETFTLLLLACEKSAQWGRVTEILSDMQRRRVRGSEQTLNLLLKGLLQQRLHSFAGQLHRTMVEKRVPVWKALEEGVQPMLR